MRHLKSGRKLNRDSAHRKAMFRNMVTSLMLHGRVRTTHAKAKELRRHADRMIGLGKAITAADLEALNGDELTVAKSRRLHNIRRANAILEDKAALAKVFGEYADRFKARPGGYTRIYKVGFRPGDSAPMAIIELVGEYKPESAAPAVDATVDAPPAESPAAEAAAEEKSE